MTDSYYPDFPILFCSPSRMSDLGIRTYGYDNNPAINQSSLVNIAKGQLEKNRRAPIEIQPTYDVNEMVYMTFGKLVECLICDPLSVDRLFQVVDFRIPSGRTLELVNKTMEHMRHHVLEEMSQDTQPIDNQDVTVRMLSVMEDDEMRHRFAYDAATEIMFQPAWGAAAIGKYFDKEARDFTTELIGQDSSNRRRMISPLLHEQALAIARNASSYLVVQIMTSHDTGPVIIQPVITFKEGGPGSNPHIARAMHYAGREIEANDTMDVECKGRLDLVKAIGRDTVDIYDIKVISGDYSTFFQKYFLDSYLYVQAGFYTKGLANAIIDCRPWEDHGPPINIRFHFLLISSRDLLRPPIRVTIGPEWIQAAWQGFDRFGRHYPGIEELMSQLIYNRNVLDFAMMGEVDGGFTITDDVRRGDDSLIISTGGSTNAVSFIVS